MKFSEAWLREWVDPPISTRTLAARLTMAGLEVDSVAPAAPIFSEVVVARVLDVAPHPDSDHLTVCQVDDGGEHPLQVVCGALNVEPGMLSPLARRGAQLPHRGKIEETLVRGIESFGVLCSARELGLLDSSVGLMILPADAPVGASIRDYMQLDDAVLDLDLTPNRADCLSIAGIAREVAALTHTPLRAPRMDPIQAVVEDRFPIAVEAAADCPRYVGRVIRSLSPKRATPLWLQERLRRAGLRSINAVVDVTNYVMLELGQPLHAFDLGELQGGIRVRPAREAESLTLLDGERIELAAGTLVIADHEKAVALAGIMGGRDSAVDAVTRDVFLESAFFTPRALAGKARAHALATDSSHRFERGVDPELQTKAIERATALLLDIGGGKPGPVVDIVHREFMPVRPTISLRPARVERLLGSAPATGRIMHILQAVGCRIEERNSGLLVRPPSFRFDLWIEADLIEEIARMDGYEHLPATIRSYRPVIRQEPEPKFTHKRLRSLLVDRGYQEAITYSFVDANTHRLFSPQARPRRLANPISAEMAVMRNSLWPGLAKAAQYNLNRQQGRVRLFETGLRFVDEEDGLRQTPMLAAIATGDALPEHWGATPREVDFYDIKGDVEALWRLGGAHRRLDFEPELHPALHPGQSARVVIEGRVIGRLGALHPVVLDSLGMSHRAVVFELELDALDFDRVRRFREVSKFPAIRRDIAVVVDESVSAASVRECLDSLGEDRLREIRLFDVYRGQGIADGRKSLALGLILQDLTRTLNDEDVDAIVARVVAKLEQMLGGTLRG